MFFFLLEINQYSSNQSLFLCSDSKDGHPCSIRADCAKMSTIFLQVIIARSFKIVFDILVVFLVTISKTRRGLCKISVFVNSYQSSTYHLFPLNFWIHWQISSSLKLISFLTKSTRNIIHNQVNKSCNEHLLQYSFLHIISS